MRLVYRFCNPCKSTHVGPKDKATACPYESQHTAPRFMVPALRRA